MRYEGGAPGFCSAVLIASRWAVTAAHCLTFEDDRGIIHNISSIVLGALSSSKIEKEEDDCKTKISNKTQFLII